MKGTSKLISDTLPTTWSSFFEKIVITLYKALN